MKRLSLLSLLTLPLLAACGGSGGSAQDAGDVSCPPGQTFDGEFCAVDQNVASREEPAPVVAEPVEAPPEEEAPVATSEEEPPVEEETPEEAEPEEEVAAPSKATPVDVTMAAQAAPLVQYLAASHLPSGARPFGSPFAGQFAEGQVLERKVQLTVGKCYTVVAAGLPPIGEVNIELFSEGEKSPAATDSTTGLQAVLGSRDKCFSPKSSGPYRLVLTVARGQGVAAAQAFQK